MKVFLLDLWQDLRAKRLWPVAVVLLLGLAAVPVLLAKPAEDPGPAPVVKTPPPSKEEDEQDSQLALVNPRGGRRCRRRLHARRVRPLEPLPAA